MVHILGIDIGGTGIKGAIVNVLTGELVSERHKIATPQPAKPNLVLDTVNQLIKHFQWQNKKIGFGFPSLIREGKSLTANNLDDEWINKPIIDFLKKGTNCELTIINDADAAGYAEVKFGKIDQEGLIILLTLGTGIGSAMLFNGALIKNTELGSLKWKESKAEFYVANSVRERQGLKYKEWATELNKFLDHVVTTFSPKHIILGGGVSKKFHKYEEYLKPSIPTPISTSQFLNNAGIIGAAKYAADHLN